MDPPITVAISTALGSAPMEFAIDKLIGTRRAVVAVLDMKFVITADKTSTTIRSKNGDGLLPRVSTMVSAMNAPAPD